MPFFPEKNLFLIHIPKNGGATIEKNLGIPIEWGLDITPSNFFAIQKKISFLGRSKKMLREILNYPKTNSEDFIDWDFLKRKMVYGYYGEGFAFQHATLSEVIGLRLVPPEILYGSRVVAVYRHPMERAKSIFKYWLWYKQMSFEDFCVNYVDKPWKAKLTHLQFTHLRPQFDFVSVNGTVPNWVELISIDELSNWLFINYKIKVEDYAKKIPIDIRIVVTDKCEEIIQSRYENDYTYFNY